MLGGAVATQRGTAWLLVEAEVNKSRTRMEISEITINQVNCNYPHRPDGIGHVEGMFLPNYVFFMLVMETFEKHKHA